MSEEDFYEDDEPVEDIRSAWKQGEMGESRGPRDLGETAKGIIDRAVADLDAPETVEFDTDGWFGPARPRSIESSSATKTERQALVTV